MKKVFKTLLFCYLGFVLVKSILSYFIPAPSIFSDEYLYAKMARSFFNFGSFSVHGIATHQYPPLYPIILSISYIFSNMKVVYVVMKVINAAVSSLVIFPAFFMAKEFLSEKKSLLLAVLVSVLPSNFAFTPFLMAENLFYPLFLFSVYFIYKSFTNQEYKWDVLAGIFIGLSYLAKASAIILVGVVGIVFLIEILRKKRFVESLKKKVVLGFMALIAILPWLIRNGVLFGFTPKGILGMYIHSATYATTIHHSFGKFLVWMVLQFGFLILASGVLFYLTSLFAARDKRDKVRIFLIISLITIINTLIIPANNNSKANPHYFSWLTGRPFGRYIDMVLPLILIAGFIGFKFFEDKKYSRLLMNGVIVSSLVLLFSSQISLFPLFPVNNLSLSHFGVLNYVIEFLFYHKTSFEMVFYWGSLIAMAVIFAALPFVVFGLYKKDLLKLNKVIPFFIVLFLGVSILCYAITYYNSDKFWYKGEQMQLGLWMNSYDRNANILFDKNDCVKKITKTDQEGICESWGLVTISGFWMNDNIKIGSVTDLEGIDYVVSRHKLTLESIKRSESGIYIYKVGNSK